MSGPIPITPDLAYGADRRAGGIKRHPQAMVIAASGDNGLPGHYRKRRAAEARKTAPLRQISTGSPTAAQTRSLFFNLRSGRIVQAVPGAKISTNSPGGDCC